jgi:ubiquinone/menaquinone biosynthesis C-methylase UbiE
MQRPEFIARQAAAPTGLLGRLLVRVMARETLRFNREVVAAVVPERGERILEVGFGHGRTLAEAAQKAPGATFAGIDVSADALRVAESRCRKLIARGVVELRVGECAALPWADSTFDKAFSVHTLYFWSDPERELGEIARVLKPRGLLVLGFRERSDAAVASFPAPIYRFRATGEVESLLKSVGFVDVETRAAADPDLRMTRAHAGQANAKDC